MMKKLLEKQGIFISNLTVHKYMNIDLKLFSVVRRKKPGYKKGVANKIFLNLLKQKFNASKPNEILEKDSTSKKSIDEIAKEVISGAWGNGQDRKNRIEQAGYDYNAVQNKVNELCETPKKSVDEIAIAVIRGEYGNGADRKNKIIAEGYDYNAVQARVNALLS